MNTEAAIISLTEKSIQAAYKLSDIFENADVYIMEKHREKQKSGKAIFYQKLDVLIDEIFEKYKAIIFIMATGIVIRHIARHIKDKTVDPAIIVCDEKLTFAISLLSGHIGGANEICRYIGEKTGAFPVITTATDINDKGALDNIALRLKAYKDEDRELYKNINYMLANDDKVYLLSDVSLPEDVDLRGFTLINYKKIKSADNLCIKNDIDFEKNKFEENGIYKKNEFIIHITYRKKTGLEYLQNYAKITPKCIYIGIGCKKNTPYDIIKHTLMKYLFDNNIDMTSIAKIGSIDIKRNEQGIINLAEKLGIEFITFTSDEIISSRYYNDIPKNDFVKSITGVDSVSLSCAKILSEDNIIAENFKGNGITLSAGLKLY
ncbi:MAG: cobalt-precorrin 5A hydrolase [Peptoanaerobacter stomatis]|uniref:cobalt-precorrin 5A hydrolase n=1 Tax=Peptoanaerobacter stomatis TaxID=796937 RepID=UPI003FA09B7E